MTENECYFIKGIKCDNSEDCIHRWENKLMGMPSRQGKTFKYSRFSKEKAFEICNRRLRHNVRRVMSLSCFDCYYHDGKCEFGNETGERCAKYRDDISFTNLVRENILANPKWVERNFNELCQIDKELFIAIYGVSDD